MDKSYKGAHLHLHFSGVVRVSDLLDTLSSPKWRDQLFYRYDNAYKMWVLSFVLPGRKSNFNQSLPAIRKLIEGANSSNSQYEEFGVIGGLFYDIIKDTRFTPTYIGLIASSMERERVDHVELRLKLGSLLRPKPRRGENRFMSIQEEIEFLSEHIPRTGKSIKIIPQFGKGKRISDNDVYNYFITIAQILASKPEYRSLIVAFDLTGPEEQGKSLFDMEGVIKRILLDMEKIRVEKGLPPDWSIPFFFHAGEVPTEKGLNNVRFALQYGGFFPLTRSPQWKPSTDKEALYAPNQIMRIGHGVYGLNDPLVAQSLYDHGVVLEFCPLSMERFKNLQEGHTLKILLSSPLMFSINADDPNKIDDKDLNDNIVYLMQEGVSEREIALAYRVSILGSQCSDRLRQEMLSKWKEAYHHLFDTTLSYLVSPTESLSLSTGEYYQDVEKRYPFRTGPTGFRYLQELSVIVNSILISLLEQIVERGLDPLTEIMKGYLFYAKKPAKKYASVTWTEGEYDNLGFQLVYIRIKGFQRFVEMFSLLQRLDQRDMLAPLLAGLSDLGQRRVRIISVGGGPGFELYAISQYIEERYPNLVPEMELISIDPVQSWEQYNDFLGIEYIQGRFENVLKYARSLLIFSYVITQLPIAPSYFSKLLSRGNIILLNEGSKILPVLNDSSIPCLRLLSSRGRDDRQCLVANPLPPSIPIEGKDKEEIIFPDVPYC